MRVSVAGAVARADKPGAFGGPDRAAGIEEHEMSLRADMPDEPARQGA
jgi:hypothetical protein